MLKNIKSTYFIQNIFANLDEKRKLKVIKCNKYLQNIININIINYKYFFGRYIIYEQNGIGKEYDGKTNKIRYEGEYEKGKRKGKGKEYNEYGRLIYEGEYLNGKRNGKGKEYYYDGNLKFEGEYKNDKQWIGVGYDINRRRILYKLNNNINGNEYSYFGKLIFEGEYLNGYRNGKGKEYYLGGKLKFEGEFKNNLEWNGKGYDRFNNTIYELKDGKGLIKEYNRINGNFEFEGEYINGKRNGKGKEYYSDNGILKYEGDYLYGKRNGKGKEYYSDNGKLLFEGEYLYDFKIKGKFYVNDHLEYEGDYIWDKKWNGKGYDENGNIIYELINGNGNVKEYDNQCKLRFEGEYLNGKKKWKRERI